ncbi:MAG: amidohydrolase family protein [Gammaproteobacteria bacterium]|jgi:imidazolonepropionase-like amidohydrolase|nr:amidohydrolase family protein [Gammaproteobacteria bacterium]
MQRSLLFLVLLLAHAAALAAGTAFVNVNVVPMTSEAVIEQQTVLVDNGRIVAIGPVDDIQIPERASVVDGTDRYLMPGLAEMHAHVPGSNSANLGRYFSLYVANGVTTVRGMLGQPSHLALRQDLLDGKVFGPRLFTSGPSLNGRSVNGADQARQLVEEQHAAGYDFIKVHPGLDSEEFEALARTANALDMPFAGHVPVAVGVSGALELNMASIDHLDGYLAALLPANSDGLGGYGGFFDVMLADELQTERIADIARETAAAGTWNVPTEVLIELRVDETPVSELRNWPEMRYMPAATVERWADAKQSVIEASDFDPATAALAIEIRRKLILELHRAGGGLLLGADSPQVFNVPGFSIHRELDALVSAGLTPFEALRTGTAAVDEFLQSNTGIVAVGRAADLVLLDANPLVDIRNARRIHGVMVRGQWYTAATLAARLDPYLNGE